MVSKNNSKGRMSKPIVKQLANEDEIAAIEQQSDTEMQKIPTVKPNKILQINFEIDIISICLFIFGVLSRMYKLEQPRNIVFDELHYGKYISLYIKNTFFFDSQPPLGKQLIALAASLANFDGNYKFDNIGSSYSENVPLYALRLIPSFSGGLIIPVVYHLMLEFNFSQWTSLIAALLLLFDNALLTQSRFILMESMMVFFAFFGLFALMKFRKQSADVYSGRWFFWLIVSLVSLTSSLSIKYVGFYSCCLALYIMLRDFWSLLTSKLSDTVLYLRFFIQFTIVLAIPMMVYLSVFFIHLNVLYKAGPHDSIMTSAFQASLEGGLASITEGQPRVVAHGSQITLRHSHGRTCWLHSHNHTYPIRYTDKRGSSHQQQVTCYSFKDVNNWWIVKRPNKKDLIADQPVDAIKDGDMIQLIHGITSRTLNSHGILAPVSRKCQEVSCYIDYNVSMPAQNLWRVEILNKQSTGEIWNTIQSFVRLIHVNSKTVLKLSGKQLPEWGFHQHEIVSDKIINQDDTIWNVEEHRYTKSKNKKESERELTSAEMIPMSNTKRSFWEKFTELQYKMWFPRRENIQDHMYSSHPLEWPLMSRGIAYWVSKRNNAQIHLLGNIMLWYSATLGLVIYIILLIFYLFRRRRLIFDIDEKSWEQFRVIGEFFLTGYILHYLPYFFVGRTLFLHHYLPAFVFKTLLLSALMEHLFTLFKDILKLKIFPKLMILFQLIWLASIVYVYVKFSVLSYGTTELTIKNVLDIRWKETWDLIIHKQ